MARDYRPKVEANEFSQHYLIKFQVTVCTIACLQSNSFDFLPVNFQFSFNTKICMISVQPTLGYIVTLTEKLCTNKNVANASFDYLDKMYKHLGRNNI